MNKLKNNLWITLIYIAVGGLISCDFTPPTTKRIILAQSFIKKQEFEKASFEYLEILSTNPDDETKIKIHFQLAELYSIHLNQHNMAIDHLLAIQKMTDSPLWLVRVEEKLGEIYFSYLKNFEKSAIHYQKLSDFVPQLDNLDFYQWRNFLSLFFNKKYEEAKKVLIKVKDTDGHKYQLDSLYYLGLVAFEKKEWTESIAYWQEFIKREKRKEEIVKAKFLMANAYETLEDLKSSYDLYYSILGEYPNTAVIEDRLKSIYRRRVNRKRP